MRGSLQVQLLTELDDRNIDLYLTALLKAMAARARIAAKPAVVRPEPAPPPSEAASAQGPSITIETANPNPEPTSLDIDSDIEIDVDLIAIMEKDSRKSEKQKTGEIKDHTQLLRDFYDKQKKQLERAEQFSEEIKSAKKATLKKRMDTLKTTSADFSEQQRALRETIAKEIQENSGSAPELIEYFNEQKIKKGLAYETDKHIADKINTVALYKKLEIDHEDGNENRVVIKNRANGQKLVEITNFPEPTTCVTKIAAAEEKPDDLACLLMVKAANDRLRMDPSSSKKFNIKTITPASAEAGMRLFLYGKGYGLEPSIDKPSLAAIEAYIEAPGKPSNSLADLYLMVTEAENKGTPIPATKIHLAMRMLQDQTKAAQKAVSPKPTQPEDTASKPGGTKPGGSAR